MTDRVRGFDDAPAARVVGLEQGELLPLAEARAVTPSSRIRCPRTSGRASSSAVRKIGSVRSVGSGSVRWRVMVRNDESRIFTVIVEALTPESRSRPATPSLIASSVRSISSGSEVSTSNVCSWPIDLAGSRLADRVGVDAARPLAERRPVLAEPPVSRSVRQRRQVADRPDAVLAEHRRRLRSDAPQPRDRSGARNVGLRRPAATTTSPSGLRRSEAIFATSFVVATPTEIVSSTASRTSSLIRRPIVSPSPNSYREPVTSRNASSIEIGSTCGVNRRRIAIRPC